MARTSSMMRRALFGALFGILVYLGISLWVGFDQFGAALEHFPWQLVPVAMGLSFTNYLIRFLKWERYRSLLEIELDRKTSFLIYLAGFSMGVTPGKMGEVLKSWLIKKVTGVPIHRSAPIVIAERITDLLGFLILVAIGGLATRPEYQWIFWAVLALCAALIALCGSARFARLVYLVVKNTPYFWRVAHKIEGSFESTRVLLTPREIAMPTAISVISWGCECLGFWLIANAMTEAEVPLLFAVFAYSFSAVAGAVLILFPGGIGPTEGFMGRLLRVEYTEELATQDPAALGLGNLTGAALDEALVGTARGLALAAVFVTRFCTLWFGVGVGMVALALFKRRYGRIEEEALEEE